MPRLIILTLLTLLPNLLSAQTPTRLEDDRFIMILKWDSIADERGYYEFTPHTIETYHKGDKHPKQTIRPEVEEPIRWVFMDNPVKLEDVNFDGYHDIMIKSFANIYGYTYWQYYIYNRTSHKFELDTALENYCNITFNPDNKSIHSFYRIGLSEFGHRLFKWEGRKLVKVAEVISYEYAEPNEWSTVTRWHENGEMKEEWVEETNYGPPVDHYNPELLYRYLR